MPIFAADSIVEQQKNNKGGVGPVDLPKGHGLKPCQTITIFALSGKGFLGIVKLGTPSFAAKVLSVKETSARIKVL